MATTAQTLAKSLKEQLKRRGANEYHFFKLIDDYCFLYETKQKLMEDIKKTGATISEYNVKGFEVHKTNPSITELTKVNGAMLKILDLLDINPDNNIADCEGNDDTGL